MIDPVRNKGTGALPRRISPGNTSVAVLVVPTDEELEIARQTQKKVVE